MTPIPAPTTRAKKQRALPLVKPAFAPLKWGGRGCVNRPIADGPRLLNHLLIITLAIEKRFSVAHLLPGGRT